MKRSLSLLMALFLAVGIIPIHASADTGPAMPGDGSPGNPYLITTLGQLDAVRMDMNASYKLIADIDASETAGWNGGQGFEPIGNHDNRFKGHFDGNGHLITGLAINRSETDDVGLFGFLNEAEVYHIGLEDIRIKGKQHVGGIAGYSENSQIGNAYTTGSVNGNDYVGGIAGWNDGSQMINAYSTADVSGHDSVGGLAGYNLSNNALISNAYAVGRVTGSSNVGGVAGQTLLSAAMFNVYASGRVSGNQNVGGLVGLIYSAGKIVSSYWDMETTGVPLGAGSLLDAGNYSVTGLGTAGALKMSSYAGFDFGGTWFMVDGSTRPFLRSEWSEEIRNPHQLQLIAMNRSVNYTLVRDIDFGAAFTDDNASDMWATSTASNGSIDGSGFAPVLSYNGLFDGQDHIIRHLTINRPQSNQVGLFGMIVNPGIVRRVGLEGGSVSGGNFTGALVGHNNTGKVEMVYSKVPIRGKQYVGGLVGNNGNESTVSLSYASGSVNGEQDVGGLVGYNLRLTRGGLVSQSYATGNVSGNLRIGGLVGTNDDGTLENSYAIGDVNGQRDVGGLVGITGPYSQINQSYAAGRVTSIDDYGGLAGRNGGSVSASYYNKDTSGQSDTGRGMPLSTSEMKQHATYGSEWDFTHTWTLQEGKAYPVLQGIADNLGFDAAPPTLVGAKIELAHPDRVIVTFDEAVNIVDGSGITLSADGTPMAFAGISGSGTPSLTIALGKLLKQGQNVVLSYDMRLGNLTDQANNRLRSVANQAVENGSPPEDETPPQIEVTMTQADGSSYPNEAWTNQSVTISAAATDESGISAVAYSLDGEVTWIPYTTDIVLRDEGVYSFSIRAVDKENNESVERRTLKIDKTPPSIHFDPNGSETWAASASPKVTVDDAGSGIDASTLQYVWTTEPSTPADGWIPLMNGASLTKNGVDGDWILHIRAKDQAGNVRQEASARFRLTTQTGSGTNPGTGAGGGQPLPDNTFLIGVDGSTISFDGGQIVFPAGAMKQPFHLTIEPILRPADLPISGGDRLASQVISFNKDQARKFDKGVTISLRLDVHAFRSDEMELLLCWFDEATKKWVALKPTAVDWEKGIVSGTTDHFTPFAVIARPIEKAQPGVQFTDFQSHWAKETIEKLAAKGMVNGYKDGTFKPDHLITRAEFASMLVRALSLTAEDSKGFADTADHWARQAISIAYASGIVQGYDQTTFAPDDLITREQMAVMTVNALQLDHAQVDLTFADRDKISPWAREAIVVAAKYGLIDGYPDNTARPQSHATRAEAATVIWRALNKQ